MPDPLPTEQGQGSEPASSWMLVRFITAKPRWELQYSVTINFLVSISELWRLIWEKLEWRIPETLSAIPANFLLRQKLIQNKKFKNLPENGACVLSKGSLGGWFEIHTCLMAAQSTTQRLLQRTKHMIHPARLGCSFNVCSSLVNLPQETLRTQ